MFLLKGRKLEFSGGSEDSEQQALCGWGMGFFLNNTVIMTIIIVLCGSVIYGVGVEPTGM